MIKDQPKEEEDEIDQTIRVRMKILKISTLFYLDQLINNIIQEKEN